MLKHPSKDALKQFAQIKTVLDAINWHKHFTPWFTDDQCVTLAESYWRDYEKEKQDQKKQKNKEKKDKKKGKKQQTQQDQQEIVEQKNDTNLGIQKAKMMTEFEKLYLKT